MFYNKFRSNCEALGASDSSNCTLEPTASNSQRNYSSILAYVCMCDDMYPRLQHGPSSESPRETAPSSQVHQAESWFSEMVNELYVGAAPGQP